MSEKESQVRPSSLDWVRAALYTVAAIAGLTVSSMLLMQIVHAPIFCEPGSGCDVVQHSPYAKPFGVPLPVLGTIYFLAALIISIASLPRTDLWLRAVGAVGFVSGVLFLGIQGWKIGQFCQLCVIVDSSAIVLAVAVYLAPRAPGLVVPRLPVAVLAMLAIAVPVVAGLVHSDPEPVPEQVAELPSVVEDVQEPGKVTIVEFIDFECPYCRALHETLSSVLEDYGDRVNVVRFHRPLPSHSGALPAALAACCAEEQGYGDAMADALFRAEELTTERCEEIAADLGLDLGAYRDCIESGRAAEILQAHEAAARNANVRGLPTYFIGSERFVGLSNPATIRASIERALEEIESEG